MDTAGKISKVERRNEPGRAGNSDERKRKGARQVEDLRYPTFAASRFVIAENLPLAHRASPKISVIGITVSVTPVADPNECSQQRSAIVYAQVAAARAAFNQRKWFNVPTIAQLYRPSCRPNKLANKASVRFRRFKKLTISFP